MRDLARLSAFLHAKSPAAARRAAAAITKSVQTLAVHPQIGRPLPDLEPQYRELLIEFGSSGYAALYRIEADRVVVLTLRHQREVLSWFNSRGHPDRGNHPHRDEDTSPMSTSPGRSFDAEVKLQIIRMIRDDGLSVARVCREQGLADSAVRRSLVQYDAEQAGGAGIGKPRHACPSSSASASWRPRTGSCAWTTTS